MSSHQFEHLLPFGWQQIITSWLIEDVPSFDYGAHVVGSKVEEANLFCKANGVLAGTPFFNKIFETLDCCVNWFKSEGEYIDVSNGNVIAAVVKGPASKILQGERVALNLIARASGIATQAYLVKSKAREANFKGIIAGTRKTTPGFRLVEKYAMLVGGCDTHRMDLSSMIMLKDNHIWSTGNIRTAIAKAKSVGGFSLKIEVECRSLEEGIEAASNGADIVMLDNMRPPKLHEEAQKLKEQFPHILIEASGGVTLSNIEQYFSNSIDILSMGSLTQGVNFVDFSLKIKH
eukprot:TRINITY_DN3171_c0_g3_i1.p1 TRINITY_DN3171_c0_g3~~TRINITY_DN3171_c0_g3_i1.p1  ORF type:complete len:290 (+),score=135.88 TRINITY_DN3171_c0_g3_i1:746-1615(+)